MHMSKQPTGTPNTPPSSNTGDLVAGLAWLRLTVLLIACACSLSAAETGFRDPEFARIPFAQWLAENRSSQIHWSVTISPAELSTHQRLILRATARIDGKELEKRRNSGRFEALIEYADTTGHVWQNHSSVDPAKLQAAMQHHYLDIHFYAFILPGDYTVSLGVCDPKTFEHSVAIRKVHISPLKTEPLPNSWAGLPAVDLVPANTEPPDIWYLGDTQTKLNLPAETKRPLHVQLLLNTTPSQKAAGSAAALRDNMSVLIPAMKVLSQMQLRNGSIDAAMLDLTHRKVVFDQKNAAALDWDSMRKFFLDARPGIVDVRTLEGQHRMLPFFRDELKKRMDSPGDGCSQLTIVLSGPAFYEEQESVETSPQPIDPSRQLIYIRYRTVPVPRRYPPGMQAPNRFARFSVAPLNPPDQELLIPPLREDDLEKTAEPMNARIFDAASAQQFRRILAAVMEQISRM